MHTTLSFVAIICIAVELTVFVSSMRAAEEDNRNVLSCIKDSRKCVKIPNAKFAVMQTDNAKTAALSVCLILG